MKQWSQNIRDGRSGDKLITYRGSKKFVRTCIARDAQLHGMRYPIIISRLKRIKRKQSS